MDGLSKGSDTLKYLSGKVSICEEEITGLKGEINTILASVSDYLEGETADSFVNKLTEIKESILKVENGLDEGRRLIFSMVLLAEEEEKTAIENNFIGES